MIKHWQSMQDYKCFLHNSKVSFDSSERTRLHTELWKPWQKLRLFDTDKAMQFLLPFYSATGRSAKNQPQILRSFILFFLLFSEGLPLPFGCSGLSTTAYLPRSLAVPRTPFLRSAPTLTSWTGSGTPRLRTYTPGTNSSPLPGTAKSQINQRAKNRKPRNRNPRSQRLSKNAS